MTTEDRRLVAALSTEVAEQRRALEDLVASFEKLCDVFVKDPKKDKAYTNAKALLA